MSSRSPFFWGIISLLILMVLPISVHAQSIPIFNKVGSALVLEATQSWEGTDIYALTVILDGGLDKMWYAAGAFKGAPYNAPLSQIGYATSTDGTTWTKYEGNPVLSASFTRNVKGQAFTGLSISYPSVVKVAGTYFMYYRETDGKGNYMIGWAISNDGISWSKSTEPVLSGTFPDAVYANGEWKMWYSVDYGTTGNIGYATSSDGKSWQLVQRAGIPVPPQYDYADYTEAVFAGGSYHMWYRVDSSNAGRLYYATSPDGINWSSFADNPLPQEADIAYTSVVVGQTSYMWYLGGDGVYLASTTMPIPEFEPLMIMPILISGLVLTSLLNLRRRREE